VAVAYDDVKQSAAILDIGREGSFGSAMTSMFG
jgi:hypothetical protein